MPPSPRLLVVRLALFILVPKRALLRTVTGYGKIERNLELQVEQGRDLRLSSQQRHIVHRLRGFLMDSELPK